MIDIECYQHTRAAEVVGLFHRSVHAIDPKLYSEAQKEAWAPSPPDHRYWANRWALKRPFLAIIDGRVAGFMALEPDGHIDCTYVEPEFQGQGVAKALYQHIECIARAKSLQRLSVEASIPARGFFQRMGFSVLKRNCLRRRDQILINFSMEKRLRETR
jgi:putative acetyltransferase